jgi:hypothetical protein
MGDAAFVSGVNAQLNMRRVVFGGRGDANGTDGYTVGDFIGQVRWKRTIGVLRVVELVGLGDGPRGLGCGRGMTPVSVRDSCDKFDYGNPCEWTSHWS